MTNPFILSLERRDSLSPDERKIAEELSSRTRHFPANGDIVCTGDRPRESCLMMSGFSARYNLLGDGRRQITAIHFAGDFVDLHSLLLAEMDHSVLALTDCQVSMVPHSVLIELTVAQPHFSRLLWSLTVIDAAIYRQWLVASGRHSSAGQVAHFLCEVFTRMDIVGLTDGFTFRLPINQSELSDAMGLSVVHVNRTLQQLRRERLIEWQGEVVRILDWKGLQHRAEFDPTYLNLDPKPR